MIAGIHRQTWISGYILFVDLHVTNSSHKTVRKIEFQLERAIMSYNFAAASTSDGEAESLRVPHRCVKDVLVKTTLREPADVVFPRSQATRTCEVTLPPGLVSVDTGRFFGIRYFLSIQLAIGFTRKLKVQLPITLIHPNSIDIPPNSLSQVTAAIEHKHKDDIFTSGFPYRYTPGRAFVAAREDSHRQARAAAIPVNELEELTTRLEASPRKLKHRQSHSGIILEGGAADSNRALRRQSRMRSSFDSQGPGLQRSTSGLAFDDSDKENEPTSKYSKHLRQRRNSRPPQPKDYDPALRELNYMRKRSSLASVRRNIAAEAAG